MTWFRLLNLSRTLRLERELAALTDRHESMRADVVTYADIVGRQLDPRSNGGRNEDAAEHLRAVLGEAHVAPAPMHLVDRVA